MTTGRQLPDERRTRDSILQRVDLLERRLSSYFKAREFTQTWSQPGVLFEAVSGLYYPRWSSRLRQIQVTLRVAGDDPTTVSVYKNELPLVEIEIPFGLRKVDVPMRKYCTQDDYLQVAVEVVGGEPEDLVVQMFFG